MTRSLGGIVATNEYDDIIAAAEPAALTTSVKLGESEGPLLRGTVLVAESADGEFKPASKAIEATDTVLILAESVEKATSGDVVDAYKTGNFVRGRLETDGEYELAAADFEALRDAGIQTTYMLEAPGSESV